jgi:hypothetical protein
MQTFSSEEVITLRNSRPLEKMKVQGMIHTCTFYLTQKRNRL